MAESRKGCKWPTALSRRDDTSMIKYCIQSKLKRRYRKEVQALCKTSAFGMVSQDERVGGPDRRALESIVGQAKETAPLLSSLVLGVGPTSRHEKVSHLGDMKLVGIFVILCRSVHWNNSNYIPLMIALYLYSAGIRIDAITLLNHFGLSVSYDVLQKSLKNITSANKALIKQQSTNCRLVGMWDNFEYRENVHGERIEDVVKFRSVTMALWIRYGWRIPLSGLLQSMWRPKQEVPYCVDLLANAFGLEAVRIRR